MLYKIFFTVKKFVFRAPIKGVVEGERPIIGARSLMVYDTLICHGLWCFPFYLLQKEHKMKNYIKSENYIISKDDILAIITKHISDKSQYIKVLFNNNMYLDITGSDARTILMLFN